MTKKTKYILLFFAMMIIATSIAVSNKFVKIFSEEEQTKVEIWAEATHRVLNEEYSEFAFMIVENNENIPVIVVDENDNYITSRNFREPIGDTQEYYKRQIKRLKGKNPPILIDLDASTKQYIYYDDSLVLKQLAIFPYVQSVVIVAFILLALWVVFSTKESEQNKVWVGLTKETAHQLGTPVSSLSAWLEILQTKYPEDNLLLEIDKDVEKIRLITDRFSKIGSLPELKEENVVEVVRQSMVYMQKRSAKSIIYTFTSNAEEYYAVVSVTLFQWVIENLCKNALDAMDKKGAINISIFSDREKVCIDVQDTGKGMEKSMYGDIFKPGYTTKMRGWGLGLSLAKRIIENYHKGKIFVKHSEIGKGTRFRIILPQIVK